MLDAETFIPLKPCHQGHLERYVSNNNCVECEKERERRPRPLGNVRGETFIPLNPCHKGHLERYTSNNNCVECQHSRIQRPWKPEYNTQRRDKRRALRKKTETVLGKPCGTKNHVTDAGLCLRYKSNGNCVACVKARPQSYSKQERAAYIKQWRATRRRLGKPTH